MRKLIIIVEGQTELEFVKNILIPYFLSFEIYEVIPYCIQTSKIGKGGFSNFDYLKKKKKKVLNNRNDDIIITTFIDFFRIPSNFPKYNETIGKLTSLNKVEILEKSFGENINDARFIPYIQLHEFEALLFSSNKGFEKYEDEKVYKKDGIVNNGMHSGFGGDACLRGWTM